MFITSLPQPSRQRLLAWGGGLMGLFLAALVPVARASDPVTVWRSSEDGRWQLSADRGRTWETVSGASTGAATSQVDPSRAFQSMLGLEASFDHASCYNLSRLDPATRAATIERLFHPEQGIGMNLMRVCIGTSDFAQFFPLSFCSLAFVSPIRRMSTCRDSEKTREYSTPSYPAAFSMNR